MAKAMMVGVLTPSTGRLPSGYTELEYIESTGTQYIDTGFVPNQNTRVDINLFTSSSENDAVLFGAGEAYNNRAFEFTFHNQHMTFNYGSEHSNDVDSIILNNVVHVSFNKNTCAINNSQATATYQTFTAPYTMTLFALHRATVICAGGMRVYSCQIYDNGTLIRDYIPCKNASSEVGMYDVVNEAFYGNAGTGTFVAGNILGVSVARKVVQPYVEESLVARKVKNGWCEVGLVARKFFGGARRLPVTFELSNTSGAITFTYEATPTSIYCQGVNASYTSIWKNCATVLGDLKQGDIITVDYAMNFSHNGNGTHTYAVISTGERIASVENYVESYESMNFTAGAHNKSVTWTMSGDGEFVLNNNMCAQYTGFTSKITINKITVNGEQVFPQ